MLLSPSTPASARAPRSLTTAANASPLVYSDEVRLFRTPDGSVWAEGWGGYKFLTHFLDCFSSVTVVARRLEVASAPAGSVRCDGPGVSFCGVPYYVGPVQYLRQAAAVERAIRGAYRKDAVFLLRSPSQIGTLMGRVLNRHHHPFGLVVTADPDQNFAKGCNSHPLRGVFRWKYTHDLRRLCGDATGIAYVTRSFLQRKYPAAEGAMTTSFSGVELHDECFAAEARRYAAPPDPLRIVTVGSFVQLYKGQDVLLRGLARCAAQGLRFRASFIGDGRHRREMEDLAGALGLADRVEFAGALSAGEQIRRCLDGADLFVLPSRSEGLPRALLEAMARGVACVATKVGGIPEVLMDDALVAAGDAAALADRICQLARDPRRLAELARENLRRSREFRFEVLLERRKRFYSFLRRRTCAWLRAG